MTTQAETLAAAIREVIGDAAEKVAVAITAHAIHTAQDRQNRAQGAQEAGSATQGHPGPPEAPKTAHSDTAKITDAQRAELEAVINREGGEPGNSLHTWRCEDKDRYPGPCDCVARVVDELALLIEGWLSTGRRDDRPATIGQLSSEHLGRRVVVDGGWPFVPDRIHHVSPTWTWFDHPDGNGSGAHPATVCEVLDD